MKRVEDYVRSIPDFPEPGIIFRDVTTILQDGDGLHLAIDKLLEMLDGVDIDVVVGPESRGFIFGVPVAYALHKGFVPVRKKGKLPCETISAEYDLEYGSAVIEMHGDGNIVGFHRGFDKMSEIDGVGVFSRAGGHLQNHGRFAFVRRLDDRLDHFHVVHVKRAYGVTAFVRLFEHFFRCH